MILTNFEQWKLARGWLGNDVKETMRMDDISCNTSFEQNDHTKSEFGSTTQENQIGNL